MTRGGPRGTSLSADVEVVLLGGFAVRVGGHPVPDGWRLRKAKTLVKLLALADGHRMHRDDLAARLWSDLAAHAAANNVHQALYAARRAFAAAGASRSVLELRDEMVALCPRGGLHVDVFAFEEAVQRAVEGGLDEMREALDLWTGEPLPEDRYADWATDARDRLIAQWAGLTARMAEALARIGEGDAAVALGDQAAEAAAGWRDAIVGAPDELTTALVLSTAPPVPFLPEASHGTQEHRYRRPLSRYPRAVPSQPRTGSGPSTRRPSRCAGGAERWCPAGGRVRRSPRGRGCSPPGP